MFTAEQREQTRQRLLGLAEQDDEILGAAITGSHAAGTEDAWSDIDLAFGIRGDLAPALARWSGMLERAFGALHQNGTCRGARPSIECGCCPIGSRSTSPSRPRRTSDRA